MALMDFETSLPVGQDGNTDAQSVDPFRNILDSISGGALQPKPLVDGGSTSDILTKVQNGSGGGGIDLALLSATSPLSGSVADHLNFTHEFGLEVAEYLSWWYEAKLYGTLGNFPRQDILNPLLNDMKAKFNLHLASAAHHNTPDTINPCLVADATDLPTSLALVNALKGAFNLHRTQVEAGPTNVHAVHDTVNVVTVANATDLPTAIALAEDIDTQYRAHTLNQLGALFHTIPDTLNTFVKGGEALFQALMDAVPEGLYQFPLVIRASESGGWFKEAITLKKMLDGVYSTGEQIKYRAFGTHAAAINAMFPNVTTPGTTAGQTELDDIFAAVFTAGEFNEPWGDASPTDPSIGLFPNWPLPNGSIIDAMGGRPHYYIGSYHTPFRHRCLLVNKAWFDGLSAAQQNQVRAAARYCAMQNLAHSYQGGDAIIKAWQGMGVVVHKALPRDLLDRFRTGLSDAQENIAGGGDADYEIMLNSQRDFMKENAVRWGTLPDRMWRVARTDYETLLKTDA